MPIKRVVWIVLDSVGIGELPDAAQYGDTGSDTLGNIARRRPLGMPNFARLGLANIKPNVGLTHVPEPYGCFGRCMLASPGKDTTTGHWEMVGIHLEQPFPLYPNGFPPEIIGDFESRVGRGTLGNIAASGTEIIKALGEEHVRTGNLIVYTSADSVFQIAAHEEVVPLDEQYRICEIARNILKGPHEVGRVIARPFVGTAGNFTRTANRKDFAVPPPRMLLDELAERSVPVHSVGKIYDVFLGRGIGDHVKTKTNEDGMSKTLEAMAQTAEGLIFVNLVDFDMLYGHRNDVEGYARALQAVDRWLPDLLDACGNEDMLILTADHGCDPTTPSTDHSREYVPLLVYGPALRKAVDLGTRSTLADIGQTVAEIFGARIKVGQSFLSAVS